MGTRALIMQGSCLDAFTMMPPEYVDCVITDPPYLVDYRGGHGKGHRIAGDRDDAWVVPAYAEMYRVLKDHSFAITFYGWPQGDVFLHAIRAAGFRVVSHLIFVKNQMGLGYYTRGKHEQAFLLAKGKPPYPKPAPPDVFPWTRVRKPLHPNEKPQDSLQALVHHYSKPNDVILDPFCGSGSTGLAALYLGRRFIGMELDAGYAGIATERLQRIAVAECPPDHCQAPGTLVRSDQDKSLYWTGME